MGPIIIKKEKFDELHNHLKNHFGTKFLFSVILINYLSIDGIHNY